MEAAEQWPLWAVALQNSSLGLTIRQSTWLYPTANVLHVLGVALLVGSILALDFRLLGFGRKLMAAEAASRYLTPFAIAGIVLLVPGGLTLFIADGGPLAANQIFKMKLSLVSFGFGNAVLFRALWGTKLKDWDRARPAFGRVQAMLSVAIWLTVPALGRLIAYF